MIRKAYVLLIVVGLGGAFLLAAQAAPPPAAHVPVRLVGDWELQGPLVLVWPEHVGGRKALAPLFTDFLQTVPEDVDVAVVSTRPPSPRVLADVGRPLRYVAVPHIRDIWIRDWAGWPGVDEEARLLVAHPTYHPRHLTGRAFSREQSDGDTGRRLADLLYGRQTTVPLAAMGGQMTHNGRQTAILSNRFIGTNEAESLGALREHLRAAMGIEHVVFLPVAPGDSEGRVDGLARFVDEHTVLVARYPETDPEGRAFTDMVERALREELGSEFRVVPIPRAAGRNPGDPSGNYLHFVQLGNRLWVPVYGLPEADRQGLAALRQALPEREIIPVASPHLLPAANEGVTLHRITTAY